MRIVNLPSTLVIVSLGLAAGLPSALLAQAPATNVGKAEPYQAVTNRDDVELRAGPGMFYYPVSKLKNGTMIKVIGEDSGFVRVLAPEGIRACIRAEDASPDNAGKVKLNRAARIMHANLSGGVPFCPIGFTDKEPEAGAEFKLLDTLKGGDGKPTYYVIAAPTGATGFINKDQVRKLTAEEAAALNKPATPAPASGEGEKPKTVPMIGLGGGTTPPADNPAATKPAETTPAAPAPTPPAPPKVDPKIAEFEALEATFKRVQAQPASEAEFAPAIAQFKSVLAKLGDSTTDKRLGLRLKNYLEVLQLRLDVQTAMNKPDVVNIEKKHSAVSEQLANLEKQGFFKVIGRLLPSTVYDGERLPKLYRIVSPEPGAARTLAYIMPQPGLDLDAKLGRIVGVAGDSKMDESLKANLVTPKRVEVLTLTADGAGSEK